MLKPQLLSTGNWLPSLAKVIKLWTLDQVLHKHLFAYLIYICKDQDTDLEKPVWVDIFLLCCSGDRLLTRTTSIFHIVAVDKVFVFISALVITIDTRVIRNETQGMGLLICCVVWNSHLCSLILWFGFMSFTTLPHVTCSNRHIIILSGTFIGIPPVDFWKQPIWREAAGKDRLTFELQACWSFWLARDLLNHTICLSTGRGVTVFFLKLWNLTKLFGCKSLCRWARHQIWPRPGSQWKALTVSSVWPAPVG